LYNFEEWFYFKNDQARDAYTAQKVFDGGLGELRLLGPRAGGSNLYLGPVSYYFRAFSAWAFQSKEPFVMAYPDLFFSILTIPLLYFFLKNFFTSKTSLVISSIYTFSYVAIQYSRFAWNPNSLPFWSLLFIFSLYKLTITKNRKTAGWYLILLTLAYSIASQLHFVALLGFPMVAFVFWFKYFPKKINWKFWLGAVFTIFILYSPVIANEIITKGNNSQHFIYTIKNRGDNEKNKTVFEKIEKTGENYGKFYPLFLTSINPKEFPGVTGLGAVFILISIIYGVNYFKKSKSEKEKIFLYLTFVCFAVFAIINYNIAYEIDRSRYWFPHFFIPFVFLGFFLDYFLKSKKKYLKVLFYFFFLTFLILQITAVVNLYLGLEKRAEQNLFKRFEISSVNKFKDYVCLSDMEKVLGFIYRNSDKNRKICLNSPGGYGSAYKYVFDLNYPDLNFERKESYIDLELRKKCQIFLITHKERSLEKQREILEMDFELEGFGKAGEVRVYKIKPLDSELNREFTKKREEVEISEKVIDINQEKLEDEVEDEDEVKVKDEVEIKQNNNKKPKVLPRKTWNDFINEIK
jgi:hypothetical protein